MFPSSFLLFSAHNLISLSDFSENSPFFLFLPIQLLSHHCLSFCQEHQHIFKLKVLFLLFLRNSTAVIIGIFLFLEILLSLFLLTPFPSGSSNFPIIPRSSVQVLHSQISTWMIFFLKAPSCLPSLHLLINILSSRATMSWWLLEYALLRQADRLSSRPLLLMCTLLISTYLSLFYWLLRHYSQLP